MPNDEKDITTPGEGLEKGSRDDALSEMSAALVDSHLEKSEKSLNGEQRDEVVSNMAEALGDALENLPVFIAMSEVSGENPQELENLKLLQMLDEKYEEGIEIEVDSAGKPFARIGGSRRGENDYILSQRGIFIFSPTIEPKDFAGFDAAEFFQRVGSGDITQGSSSWKSVSDEGLNLNHNEGTHFSYREVEISQTNHTQRIYKLLERQDMYRKRQKLAALEETNAGTADEAFKVFED
jgi:hypothetical protein